VSAGGAGKERDGLSLQTLVIAAAASGAAAIVTSYFWKNGTFVTAAITPVIVALVKEALERPIQSDVVRRPAQRFAGSRPRTPQREPAYSGTGGRSRFEEPPPEEPPPFGAQPPATGMGPVRTYGRPRRRWHLRAAIVTGVIAFVIAALVLTVPELLFGSSVSGKGRTTIFSTHSSKSSGSGKKDQTKTSTDNSKTDTGEQTTPPAQQPQGTDTSTQPQQPAPSQQPPQGGTTTPQQQPAPSTPPSAPSP